MTEPATEPKRIFFYVQHLLGIGHLARASRIAGAMVEAGHQVTLVTGGLPVKGFPGPGVNHVELPPVAAATGFSGLVDIEGQAVTRDFEVKRTLMLLKAFHEARPDIVILEAFPFGRRQVRFELLSLLEEIRLTQPKPLLFASIRDILQENRKPGRDEETVHVVKTHFDGVLVHGDPHFVRLEESFPLAAEIADRLHYTGLVAAPKPEPSADRFDIVVSAGGGAVGAALIEAALDARDILNDQHRWCVITGPNLPEDDFARFAARVPETVSFFRFRPDFPALLPEAKLSISQAGYNTVCDVLRARCPALLVPFASGGETEQTVRADKLLALGFACVIEEEGLTGAAMARAIEQGLRLECPQSLDISLEGAMETVRIVTSFPS
ncbi:glycosyl transferase [Allorhizobium sp. BGMRC 0089]|uniref:glycosyltransferase family protein n=1 Tax=Allorhizobium sonneratiae TaxID=2934936 RepID=UPI0020342919|nr:glycosyltransferase [Allorhizobium sonneratiae]MCM2290723.1 glycosyl transferase [Allorhizobium sonneratiae]